MRMIIRYVEKGTLKAFASSLFRTFNFESDMCVSAFSMGAIRRVEISVRDAIRLIEISEVCRHTL